MKKSNTVIIMALSTILVVVVGVLVILYSNLKTQLTMPDNNNTTHSQETASPAISGETPTVEEETPVAPTEEESELAKLFEDPKQLEAELGYYQGKIDISSTNYRGIVKGLKDLMPGEDIEYLEAAESLLTGTASYPIIQVSKCTKKVPKYYAGDKYWLFEDPQGYVGELVAKDGVMYLYFYGEVEQDGDPILAKGFPATSHGNIQPYREEWENNELYEDIDETTGDWIMSAMIDGEGFSPSNQFYIVWQSNFEYKDLFDNVVLYKINVDLGPTFVEVYIDDINERYYTIRTENPMYADIVPERLIRNYNPSSSEYDPNSGNDPDDDSRPLEAFKNAAIASYIYSTPRDRDLCPAALEAGIEEEYGLYSLNYALIEHGWENVTLTPTTSINGYDIKMHPILHVYTVTLPDSEEGSVDYYASVNVTTRMVYFYPPDATPEQ